MKVERIILYIYIYIYILMRYFILILVSQKKKKINTTFSHTPYHNYHIWQIVSGKGKMVGSYNSVKQPITVCCKNNLECSGNKTNINIPSAIVV